MGDPLLRRLRSHRRVLEVGIGRHTRLARQLHAAGVEVVAIDIDPVVVPPGVTFRRVDVAALSPADVAPIDAVYGRHLPPELHGPSARLAEALGADLLFTTLGADPPTVDVHPRSDPEGTVFVRPAAVSEDV
ncbi:MAG: UPF0146 family protein [Halobacteriota archaeon]